MLEKEIEERVCRYAKLKGLIAYKFTSPNRRSVPDRLFVGPNNLHFFIEFKAPGKKPTLLQHREITRLKELEQHVYLIDDVDTGKAVIDAEIALHDASLSGKRDRVHHEALTGGSMDGHGSR